MADTCIGRKADQPVTRTNMSSASDSAPGDSGTATVVVDGVINGDIVQGRFAEYLESLGEDGSLEPDAIAEAFWMLHSQIRAYLQLSMSRLRRSPKAGASLRLSNSIPKSPRIPT